MQMALRHIRELDCFAGGLQNALKIMALLLERLGCSENLNDVDRKLHIDRGKSTDPMASLTVSLAR